MRQGEMLALRWRTSTSTQRASQVRATLQRRPDGLVLAEPRADRSRRRVMLTQLAIAALRRHRIAQAEE
jgi:integrase